MKVKGAGFFELHIEKIVLAVVAAVFVLVLVIQLGADGPTVTVNNQPLPLDLAYEPAEDLAKQARTRMTAQEPELPEVGEQVDLLGRFQRARAADLAPRDRIVLGPAINLGDIGEGEGFGNTEFVELRIPGPEEVVAYSFAATLDPWVVTETEGLSELVGDSQPYDKAAVSVQAAYDTADLIAALQAEPEGDLNPWPVSWWRGSMEILAVRLERQRQNADGSWPASDEAEVVPPPPGMIDLPGELAETPDLGPRHIKSMVEEVQKGLAQQVRRPAFYPVIAGDPWVEPREGVRLVSLEAGANPDVARLQRQWSETATRLEQLRQEREQIVGRRDPRQGEGQALDRATANRLARTEREIERIERQREQIAARLTELGFPPEEAVDQQDPGARRQPDRPGGRRQDEVEPLFAGETIQLWAHDLTAEPGAVYRYRVRLVMNNPAYGQQQFLVEQQQTLAADPTVLSEPSEWTQPVLVAPMAAFFVTGANEAQQGAMGVRMANANVEVFTFLYGYYRKGQKTLEPGDPVAAWAELPEGLPIFDVSQPPPVGGPAMPAPIAEPPDPRGREAPPAGDTLPIRTLAAADAYLLDVYESAAREGANGMAAARPPRIVTFGNSAGEVVRRLVDADRQSSLYARLSASAEAGATQGQPEPEAEQPQDPRRPPEPPPPPPDPTGGGGGGGGGG